MHFVPFCRDTPRPRKEYTQSKENEQRVEKQQAKIWYFKVGRFQTKTGW